VLGATLFPFDFFWSTGFSIQTIPAHFFHPTNLNDQIQNILLFIPFGFGLTGWIQRTRLGKIVVFILVLAASASFSFTVEVIQIFLPSRSSTISDVVTNTIGGCLGFVGFNLGRAKIPNYAATRIVKIRGLFSIKTLVACFIGYATLTFLIAIALQNATNLEHWNPAFPLLLGNEATGDRPWQGYISQVYVADKAFLEEDVASAFSNQQPSSAIANSLVAYYQFTGKGSYPDQTRHLPELSWQGQSPKTVQERGIFLSSSHWLRTTTPATLMAQKIRRTSQFTLSATIATSEPAQTGPARIISFSGSPYERNFTLGQEGTDLVFRLRTPITGDNGITPEFIIPNIFADNRFHSVIVTYDGSTLRFYIDQLQNLYAFVFSPEVTIFRYFLPELLHLSSWNINLNCSDEIYRIVYYSLNFIPLGFILAFITPKYRSNNFFSVVFYGVGIILPSLILEIILASGSGRQFRLDNVLLSLGINASTMLLVKHCILSHPYRGEVA
jgi:glycopeptide antibiotics resistance protein